MQVRTPEGLGSGFFINADGYLITNFHVIEGETEISVEVYRQMDGQLDRETYKQVRIIAINKFHDLALLQIEDKNAPKFKYVTLGNSDALSVGDPVFAIGSPLGLERTVTEGILSTKTRELEGELYLQTTAQINPGNSGGPLFNMAGEVVGVTNMKITFGEGLGFAIPVELVKNFLDHRDAFAYSTDNPNNPYRYLEPPSTHQSQGLPQINEIQDCPQTVSGRVPWISDGCIDLRPCAPRFRPPKICCRRTPCSCSTAPDCAALRAASHQSPQWLFWNDPAMKPFHDKFVAKWDAEFVAPLERDLGVKLADFAGLPQGQFALALTQNGWNGSNDVNPGVLLLLDARNKSDLLKTNLAALRKKWTAAGKPLQTETLHGIPFSVVTLSSNDVPGSARQNFPRPASRFRNSARQTRRRRRPANCSSASLNRC